MIFFTSICPFPVWFANSITHMNSFQILQACCLCRKTSGICVQCSHPKCPASFHVICALNSKWHLRWTSNGSEDITTIAFCSKHKAKPDPPVIPPKPGRKKPVSVICVWYICENIWISICTYFTPSQRSAPPSQSQISKSKLFSHSEIPTCWGRSYWEEGETEKASTATEQPSAISR